MTTSNAVPTTPTKAEHDAIVERIGHPFTDWWFRESRSDRPDRWNATDIDEGQS